MKNISRLVGLASSALKKASSSSGAPGANGAPGASGAHGANGANGANGKDWRSIVRSAADSITGDSRAAGGAPGTGGAYGQFGTLGAPAPGAPTRRSSAPADRYAPPPAPYGGAGTPYSPPAAADRYSPPAAHASRHAVPGGQNTLSAGDRQAVARYDYLVETAAPHQIEAIHRDAFARLTPAQRGHIESRMRAELPAHEAPLSSDPAHLARAAARGEASQPGALRRILAGAGAGAGAGTLASGRRGAGAGIGMAAVGGAGAVLAAVAGGAIVSTVAGPLLADAAGLGIDFDAAAQALNVDELTGGIEAMGENASSIVGEQATSFGEQAGSFGEQVGGFEIPGFGSLGDLFNR